MRVLLFICLVGAAVANYRLVYDRARRCSGGPKKGVVAVSKVLMRVCGVKSMGIYNCRKQRGGSTSFKRAGVFFSSFFSFFFSSSPRCSAHSSRL